MTRSDILVLVIRDAGLRSMLSGRLSIEGELVMTYEGPYDARALARLARDPSILVTDDATVARRSAAPAAADPWIGRILIVARRTRSQVNDNLEIVDRATAARDIRLTLERWRERQLH